MTKYPTLSDAVARRMLRIEQITADLVRLTVIARREPGK
jgi:hypothetical protein